MERKKDKSVMNGTELTAAQARKASKVHFRNNFWQKLLLSIYTLRVGFSLVNKMAAKKKKAKGKKK
ncbi:MAG: hypothetical protein WCT31_02005 [Candidatus Micrarchaeia archaeon]|jgi:hypothetical protein